MWPFANFGVYLHCGSREIHSERCYVPCFALLTYQQEDKQLLNIYQTSADTPSYSPTGFPDKTADASFSILTLGFWKTRNKVFYTRIVLCNRRKHAGFLVFWTNCTVRASLQRGKHSILDCVVAADLTFPDTHTHRSTDMLGLRHLTFVCTVLFTLTVNLISLIPLAYLAARIPQGAATYWHRVPDTWSHLQPQFYVLVTYCLTKY